MHIWRGGRAVECDSLENYYALAGIGGSNPPLSVLKFCLGGMRVSRSLIRLLAEVREQGTGNGEQSEELSFYASKMIIFLLLQEVYCLIHLIKKLASKDK